MGRDDLKNDTIRLIPAEPELARMVAEYYLRNREFLREYEPERDGKFFLEDHQRSLLEQERKDGEKGLSARFYIQPVSEPGRVIGMIGLNNIVRGAFQSAFLGYKLDSAYCNHGYMTMAVAMMVEYAFQELRLHRIEANVMPRNRASLRVLEKNGFESEGLARRYLKINGIWEDHIHMVIRNKEME